MAHSPQTLTEGEPRLLAAWAADCAERVLHLFEDEKPVDGRPRFAIARARASGDLSVAPCICDRFGGGSSVVDAKSLPAIAAAGAAAQASAVCHVGARALRAVMRRR